MRPVAAGRRGSGSRRFFGAARGYSARGRDGHACANAMLFARQLGAVVRKLRAPHRRPSFSRSRRRLCMAWVLDKGTFHVTKEFSGVRLNRPAGLPVGVRRDCVKYTTVAGVVAGAKEEVALLRITCASRAAASARRHATILLMPLPCPRRHQMRWTTRSRRQPSRRASRRRTSTAICCSAAATSCACRAKASRSALRSEAQEGATAACLTDDALQ